jgi:peptide/bleomycin uptake transporter
MIISIKGASMFKPFFLDPKYRLFAWGLLALVIAITIGQVYMTVLINDWYKGFYDSLQNKDAVAFWHSFIPFSFLAGGYILLATFSVFISQHFTFKWREALTFSYLPLWQKSQDHVEGSSQRIQEDTMRFARTVHGLGLGCFRAIITLIAFIPILWGISEAITHNGTTILPGFLVWVALTSSIGGMAISVFMGRKLPRLEYNNQKTEAAFRKTLVYGEDNRTLVDTNLLSAQFQDLKQNYFALFDQFKYFGLWQNTYDQFTMLIPYVVSAESFFAGVITLGMVVQISNAFEKVHGSFTFFLNNWTDVTELQSIILRLKEFQKEIGYK